MVALQVHSFMLILSLKPNAEELNSVWVCNHPMLPS